MFAFSEMFDVDSCNLFIGGIGINSSNAPTESTFLMDSSASLKEETDSGWGLESTAEIEDTGDPSWNSICPSASSFSSGLRQAWKLLP